MHQNVIPPTNTDMNTKAHSSYNQILSVCKKRNFLKTLSNVRNKRYSQCPVYIWKHWILRFEVVRAVQMSIVFLTVTLCSLVESFRRFRDTYRLHLQA